MNERVLRIHLLNQGYSEDEIEDDLSSIAEELNDRSNDYELEKEYANQK